MSNELTPKQEADKLLASFLKGKDIYEQFSDNLRKQFTISGESMEFWAKKFCLKIPSELNTMECQKLDLQLMNLWQEASFYFSVAQVKYQLMKRGIESNYLGKFAAITQQYKDKGGKLPGANTLDTLAKIEGDTAESANLIADVEMKFWKETLVKLDTYRKLVENAVLLISVELKHQDGGRRLDNLERKLNQGSPVY